MTEPDEAVQPPLVKIDPSEYEAGFYLTPHGTVIRIGDTGHAAMQAERAGRAAENARVLDVIGCALKSIRAGHLRAAVTALAEQEKADG